MRSTLITGSTKGIGLEIARQLSQKGWQVFISGRNNDRLNTAEAKFKKEGVSVRTLLMDVGSDESVRLAAAEFSKLKLKLDVLVNNAGILMKEDQALHDQDISLLEKTLNVNALGPLRVVRAFLPFMQTGARIINISSGGGSMSDPVGGWSPAYCVSKTALNSITRQLAHELSARKIAVNAVCPGWVKTDMGGKSAPRKVEQGAETPVWLASELTENITGRFFRDKQVIDW
jgi:NAD(P)-dependent dehydrogenase (short-subunit alcohol dehydrogenase family)